MTHLFYVWLYLLHILINIEHGLCKRAAYIYFQSRKTVVILKIQELVLTIIIFHDLFCKWGNLQNNRVIDLLFTSVYYNIWQLSISQYALESLR